MIAPRAARITSTTSTIATATFWIRTNDKGRNFRLVTAPRSDPSRANWKEVVPHREDVMLEGVDLFKDFYVAARARGRHAAAAHHRLPRAASRTASTFPEPAYR